MIAASRFEGQTLAVFGLGRTGISASLALQAGGATVLAWDDREATRDAATEHGVTLGDLTTADWSEIDALVLSPGVPHNLPTPHWSADKARASDTPIVCDVDIFARQIESSGARVVAITGTNGKSTTTSLIGHILNSAGVTAHIGGNIGRGVLDLPEPTADAVYVLELSSYQLERAPNLHPNVALLLNLTPDHLDRHGDMESYAAAKRNIFANQTSDDTAVIGADTPIMKRIVTAMKARNGRQIVPVSTRSAISHGVSVKSGKLFDALSAKVETVLDLSEIETLQGTHNHQNAACAYAACKALGLSQTAIIEGLRSFPGLAHRMEIVGCRNGVLFVNDSKATNADSAMQALKAFKNIYWIAGGMPKAGGIDPLQESFPNIAKAYLIGAAAPEFARTLSDADVQHEVSGDLKTAVKSATVDAIVKGKGVVLLSPACASFDQFKDFEARGDMFREAVQDFDKGA